jgi:uncharacterized protein YcbK (DUF882 family)
MAVVAAAAAARPARALPSLPSRRRLALVNAHTGEKFAGPYRDDKGPIAGALKDLSHFLRDFHCGAEIAIDVGVLDFLASVLDAVGQPRAIVLSAYRTPATNAMLAKTNFGVAEHSQHLYGRALDISLPARLEEAMLSARAMKRGGVGWYPNSHFMHIDSGPVRNWTLGGDDFGHLLLDDKPDDKTIAKATGKPGIKIRPSIPRSVAVLGKGEFLSLDDGQAVIAGDRLAVHHLLQKALNLQ